MPLLPLEPFVFPEDLFHRVQSTNDGECWWVLHTRPRAEKTLVRRLFKRRTSCFLPLYKRHWRKGGRSFRAHLPLFGGYVFLFGDAQARLHALETNLVSRVLHVEDQAKLAADLARVYHLILTGMALTPEERLGPGTAVEIESGPLTGIQGKIIARNNSNRFLVEVQFLQSGVSVDIDAWMIRPLRSATFAGQTGGEASRN